MKSKNAVLVLLCAALAAASPSLLAAQNIQGREMFGVRLGGVVSQGALANAFGDGSEIELHFMHGLTTWLGIDVSLSSHNLGASKDRGLNILFTGTNREVNLQIFSVTGAVTALTTISGRWTPTIEAGTGLYSANTTLPQGFYEASKTDNHFGLYGGIGLLFKITNSFSANANAKYQHVFVGTDAEDTLRFYTNESAVRFFQITVGVMIATG